MRSPRNNGSASQDYPNDLITPKEAARLVDVSVSTVYRWILSGKLKGWKVGTIRYKVSAAATQAMIRPVIVKLPEEIPLIRTREQMERAAEEAAARLRADGWDV